MFQLVKKSNIRVKRVNLQVIFENKITPSDCANLLSSLIEYILIQFQQLPGCPRTFYVRNSNVSSITEDQICSVFINEEHSRKELHKLLSDFNILKQTLKEEIEDGSITDLELHIGSGPPFTDHLVHVSVPPLSEKLDGEPTFISKNMGILFKKICECEELQNAVDDVRPSKIDVFFAKQLHARSRNFFPVKRFVDCASKSHINVEFLVRPEIDTDNQPQSISVSQQVDWYRMQGIRGFGMAHLFSNH
ncbi:uncharacterized protein LOC134543129 [Bacillus rossius redtenbacheri]|uniref:uncharacterized protein LOC134543129 n=1 Tax=Bacillus rossius redtenbacheri TaxID=93214 RepID=UPI002FDEEBC8